MFLLFTLSVFQEMRFVKSEHSSMGVFVKIYTPHQEWEGEKDPFSLFQCQVQEIPANSTSVNSQGGKCHLRRRRRVVIKFDVRVF